MKRHLIVLFLAGMFTITSCSSDDDGDTGEPILGTWVLVNVNPPALDLSACPEQSTITFNADNTADSEFYLAENDCEVSISSDSWRNKGGSTYEVTLPDLGTIDGNVEFTNSNNFIFNTSYQGFPVSLSFTRQ